jgi:hypothetical protein
VRTVAAALIHRAATFLAQRTANPNKELQVVKRIIATEKEAKKKKIAGQGEEEAN